MIGYRASECSARLISELRDPTVQFTEVSNDNGNVYLHGACDFYKPFDVYFFAHSLLRHSPGSSHGVIYFGNLECGSFLEGISLGMYAESWFISTEMPLKSYTVHQYNCVIHISFAREI